MKNNSSNTNLLYLDGLRAIAAIYVMMHHAVLQYYEMNTGNLTGVKALSIKAFFYGHFAVGLFIALSGFCLMLPVLRNEYALKGGSGLFFKKRAIRIIPPYYLAMLLSLVLIWTCIGEKSGMHWDISIPVTGTDLWTHLVFVYDFFISTGSKINHAFWSVAVECRIYLLFPLILLLWRKTGPVLTLIAAVVTSYVMYLVLVYLKTIYPDINILSTGVDPYLVCFVLGAIAASVSFSKGKLETWVKKVPSVVVLLLGVIVFAIAHKAAQHFDGIKGSYLFSGPFPISLDLAFGVFSACLLIVCSKPKAPQNRFYWLQRVLAWQPLAFTGTFAYSIYLLHAPLLQVLSLYVIRPMHLSTFASAWMLIILSVLVIVPLSYIFFLCCERPFMRLNKRVSIKQTEIAAALNPAP